MMPGLHWIISIDYIQRDANECHNKEIKFWVKNATKTDMHSPEQFIVILLLNIVLDVQN